ncbi:hypothetical protein FHETE_10553 [Fusarium heterosporum]|uniref:Uncharacterized protein n=1 Tax=Fusarium heterosporum TaxID=42747 RepID=A0A8H5SUT5_FUSHE|nr:hypothetical protein FHETE_10553 [Fusarium heterosporum]
MPGRSVEVEPTPLAKNKSQRSIAPPVSEDQPSSSQRRVTRSNRGGSPLTRLPTPPPNKRRSTITVNQGKAAKRQRNLSREHEPGSAARDESTRSNHEDEEIIEKEDQFFSGINASLLPNLRPSDSAEISSEKEGRATAQTDLPQDAEAGDDRAEEEPVAEERRSVEESGADQAPASRRKDMSAVAPQQAEVIEQEASGSEQPTPQPDASQRQPLRPSQRKKRRQSKRETQSEADHNARAPSPELGSQICRTQATQEPPSRKLLNEQDVYDMSDDEGNPSQAVLGKTKEKTHLSSAGTGQEKPQTKQKSRQSRHKATRPDQQRSKSGRQSKQAAPQTQEEDEQGQEQGKEGKEQENSENEDDCYSSDDEPAVGEEPDASHVADDSLLLDMPPETPTETSITTARIARKYVQDLIYPLTFSGWMNKRRWEQEILEQARVKAEVLAKEPTCQVLSAIILVQLYKLYTLCKDIPKVSGLQQLEYLRNNSTKFSKLISDLRQSIDRFISQINKIIEKGDSAQKNMGFKFITKLHRRIIPMSVLVIDQVFDAGCRQSIQGDQRARNQKGDFTVYLLEPLERAAGWTHRLSNVVDSWYELHPPRRERDREEKAKYHRKQFNTATIALKRELERAKEDISLLATSAEELKTAGERDEAVRKEREFEAQQRRETKELKMQRFRQSAQRIQTSQPQPRLKSYLPALHSSHPAASHPGPASSQKSSEDSYFEKHGWHYWEDDQLLSLIRTTSHPNYSVVCQMLPNRDAVELRERSAYLRTIMRDKYERKGIPPPGWCIDED